MKPRVTINELMGALKTLSIWVDTPLDLPGVQIPLAFEQTLHEVCHLTTLGLEWPMGVPWTEPKDVSRYIGRAIQSQLSVDEREDNEVKTLAAEVLTLREVGGFSAKNGEARFLRKVQRMQEIPDLKKRVLERAESVGAVRNARRAQRDAVRWAKLYEG